MANKAPPPGVLDAWSGTWLVGWSCPAGVVGGLDWPLAVHVISVLDIFVPLCRRFGTS